MDSSEINQGTSELLTAGKLKSTDVGRDWTIYYNKILKTSGIPPGKTLDIGSNEAKYSKWLKKRNIEREVVSFDIRQFGKIAGEQMVRGNAEALPFADNAFDSVVSFWSVPRVAGTNVSKGQIMQEMVRVAKNHILIWPIPDEWYGRSPEVAGELILKPQTVERRVKEYLNNLFGGKDLEIKVYNLDYKDDTARHMLVIDKK